MPRIPQGPIDYLAGFTYLKLDSETLPEDDYYVMGNYAVWGVGLITFGAPTAEQQAWMGDLTKNSDLSTFPGDWIDFGFSTTQIYEIPIWTGGVWIDGVLINAQGFSGGSWSYGGTTGSGTYYWSNDLVIDGTAAGETLLGSDDAETINGLNGDDILVGGGGADALFGGFGNDHLIGGEGVDRLFGGDGDDLLEPGLNPDNFNSFDPAADAFVDGGPGRDTLVLDYSGSNSSLSLSAEDLLSGAAFANIEAVAITGSQYVDVISGGASGDRLLGGGGFDVLKGSAGDDWLDAGAPGASTIGLIPLGGSTPDTATSLDDLFAPGTTAPTVSFVVRQNEVSLMDWGVRQPVGNIFSFTVTEAGSLGWFTIAPAASGGTWNGDFSIFDESGVEILSFPYTPGAPFEFPHAGTYFLEVSAVNSNVWSYAESYITLSLEDADVLAANELYGGTGNDTLVVYAATDQIIENANEGLDTVRSAVSWVLGANLENLTLTGSAAQGTGNELSNLLIGNAAANVLGGGSGNDRLLGAAGDDDLIGGNGLDVLAGGDGSDRLTSGTGRDILVFTASELGTSTSGEHDVVTDFQKGDLIDLSALYGGTTFGGLKAGTASQAASLSNHKAIFYSSAGKTFLVGDTNGVAGADFAIELTGSVKLTAADLLVGKSAVLSEKLWVVATGLDYDFYHQDSFWV